MDWDGSQSGVEFFTIGIHAIYVEGLLFAKKRSQSSPTYTTGGQVSVEAVGVM